MNEKQERAFELYYSMGSSRSYEKLAKKLGIGATTVNRWAKKYNWQQLIAERDRSDAELLREEVLNAKRLFLSVLTAGAEQVLRDIENGTQKVNIENFVEWGSALGTYNLDIAEGVGTQQAASNNDTPTEETPIKRIEWVMYHKE